MNNVQESISQRIKFDQEKESFLIGINGIDGSGKTEFTKALKVFLEAKGFVVHVVHVDDFHFEKAKRYQGRENPGELFYYESFNFDKLRNEVLIPLTRDGKLEKRLKLLDLESDTYSLVRDYNIQAGQVVIVEGVFLFRLDLVDYFNLRVFLTVSEEESIKRALNRDKHLSQNEIPQRYREKYLAGQRIYFKEDDPLSNVDLLVDNNDYESPTILEHA